MKTIIISAVLYAVAVLLTHLSLTPFNSMPLLISVVLILFIMGFILSLTLSVWNDGETFKERMKKARQVGFPLAAGFYILGYVFVIVESLIRG
jgi:hypothetical protein